MRKSIILLCLMMLFSVILKSEDGEAYKSTKTVLEKHYLSKNKFGRDYLILNKIIIGFYDDNGNITKNIIFKGNHTYLGKTYFNRDASDSNYEIKYYNYTDQLTSRYSCIKGQLKNELTELYYDIKGRIQNKISTRVDTLTYNQWQLRFNEVGYTSSIYEMVPDSTQKIVREMKFNYFNDLEEIRNNFYNANNNIILSIQYDEADTLISKSTYKYDNNNNLIEMYEYDKYEFPIRHKTWFYDEKNRVIQTSEFIWTKRFSGIPVLKEQVDYFYDSNEYPDLYNLINYKQEVK